MRLRKLLLPTVLAFTASAISANAQLLITEVQSDGAADFWELTNFGSVTVDLSNYKWTDADLAFGSALIIPSGTSIAPGESIVFTGKTATDVSNFRAQWNLSGSVQVISNANMPGFGSGDGIKLYNTADMQLINFTYGVGGFTRTYGTAALGGHAGISGGGVTAQSLIWNPASGTSSPRYTNATGYNFGTYAGTTSTNKGSPGFSGLPAPVTSVNLSNYVRVGRYSLPEPSNTALPSGTPTSNLLAQEASGVAYNWDTDTLFIVGDGGKSVTQVTRKGVLVDTMTLALGSSPQGTEFYDPEGVTYIGNGQFVMTEERDRQLVKFTYAAGTTLTRAATKTVKLGTFVDNTGTEGLSYDPLTGGYICLKEISPIGIFLTSVDFDLGTASNGSATTVNSVDLFDPALLGMTDVADVFALSNIPAMAGQAQEANLLVISQEDAKVVNINRSGVISSTLTIKADAGSTLAAPAQQHEGITVDRAGNVYVVNENGGGGINYPELWVYAPSSVPNQAPTAVVLNNAVNSIQENTSTASLTKIADIAVTDDGLGTNTLSLSGADAASFVITGTELFLKAGVVLDYETKTSYQVTVNVDDSSIGSAPDASVNFTLTVTDQLVETPPAAALAITEVAPWSSSVAPLSADWFEVTNISEDTVDITGWKVDDDSAVFASALALNGITSIAPGESVIFIEGSNTATAAATFKTQWFGSNPPANLQIGSYTGSGIGLSTSGDQVNLYNAAGILQAGVSFGTTSATAPRKTLDNTRAVNAGPVSLLSVSGVNGAFAAVNDSTQTGSPGYAAPGVLAVTEVAPWSSGNSPVGADWFEVTNTGARAVNVSNWKVDDSSESPAAAVALTGVSSIAPGESVIFLETSTLAATRSSFLSNWFGTNPPASLQVGGYSGSGIGLSTGGDAVNLYNSKGVRKAQVSFGTSPSSAPFTSFDNSSAAEGAITLMSAVPANRAFRAANSSTEIGSPGTSLLYTPTAFESWVGAKGYTSGGFASDSDSDGLSDGVEFFFNQNPNNPSDNGHLPKVVKNGNALDFSFTRLTQTGGLNGQLLVSGDLATWTPALTNIDYTLASSIVSGDETAITYALTGTGPSAPSASPGYPVPNTSTPVGASLGGVRVVNEGLVGIGRISGENVDSFGETQGASSGLAITDWAWNGSQFTGRFQVLPDRGYNSGSIFSNYAARLHQVDFTFTPYYGAGPVAANQVVPTYTSSIKFTYQDGGTTKYTTGLNADTVSTVFGQSVGTVVAANGPGGSQQSLLSFDAEAVYLFPDGSGYVSDEYGAYIARFNTAKEITSLTQLPEAARPHRPANALNFDSINAPTNGRRNNQGLEGMSVTPDGTRLFALLQSATVQDTNGSQQQTRNHARLFVYDIVGANRENPVLVGEYVVRLPQIDLDGNGSALDGTAAQSEIVALNNSSFLMLPRDGNGMGKGTTVPITFKSVQLVDFASASNIVGQYDGIGQQISPGGVLRPEINAAATGEVLNMVNPTELAKFGFNTNTTSPTANTLNEKIEGMALVPDLSTPQANDFFLFVGNDNDFQSSNVKMLNAAGNVVSYGDGRLNAGITNDAIYYVYRLVIDATGKKFFRMSVDQTN